MLGIKDVRFNNSLKKCLKSIFVLRKKDYIDPDNPIKKCY